MAVDPRTPVVVGVGQFTERIDDPDYRGMSAVDLATEAARAALADTGADVAAVAPAIEVFVGSAAVRDLHADARRRSARPTTTCGRWRSASVPIRRARCSSPSAATARRRWSRSSPARSPPATSRLR